LDSVTEAIELAQDLSIKSNQQVNHAKIMILD